MNFLYSPFNSIFFFVSIRGSIAHNRPPCCLSVFRMDPLKQYIYPFVVEFILLPIFTFLASTKGSCLTGAFFFTLAKGVVDNHALYGHMIANLTALEPIDCFRACRLDCRCISFNFKQRENRCQLNDENRHTNSSALGFAEGWQYYDMVMDYNIRVRNQ